MCVAAGRRLERLSGKLFGEFSLDVAVDVAGRIWILEMNAKPFRFDEGPCACCHSGALSGLPRTLQAVPWIPSGTAKTGFSVREPAGRTSRVGERRGGGGCSQGTGAAPFARETPGGWRGWLSAG